MVAAIGAVAGVAGAAINASSAGDAAAAQSGASREASAMQMAAQQQMRSDLQPWVQAGRDSQGLLNRYLGLGVGNTGVTSMGLQTGLTPDQVRQQLLSRYTTRQQIPSNTPSAPSIYNPDGSQKDPAQIHREQLDYNMARINDARLNSNSYSAGEGGMWDTGGGAAGPQYEDKIDEDALNAAINQYYADQDRLNSEASQDPLYGSLLRPFHNGAEFDSGPAFSFTGENLASDPGYQFGLNQGTQGIERGQASRGNFLSGAAMKELTRFNEDYAGTKFNDAFNRNLTTYNTNLTRRQNEWNTNLNAYENNRARIYDFLTGVSRTGQNSAAQVGTANNNTASQMASNALAAGNANAAGIIGSSNSIVSGLNSAANSINSAGGWNALLGSKPSVYSAGGSAGAGFGSGAAFGNQDLGINF